MFGQNLKKARLAKGYSQKQLAKLLDISTSTIGMYEQERRSPNTHVLKNLCNVLKISVNELVESNFESLSNEKKELNKFVEEIADSLKAQKGLMFNGYAITEKDKEKIAQAIKIAAAIAVDNYNTFLISENKY